MIMDGINNNFKEVIDMIQMNCPNSDVSDIPIAPSSILDNTDQVFLMPAVTEEYKRLLLMINQEVTALEYPFILLGNRLKVEDDIVIIFEKFVYGFKSTENLKDNIVSFDNDILNKTIFEKDYNIVSIGHTHPKVSQNTLNKTLANNLSNYIKEKCDIRNVGLNISIQDFIQYDSFRNQMRMKETFQTILMYNGELNILGYNNGIYYKFSKIVGLESEKDIIIPVSGYKNNIMKK